MRLKVSKSLQEGNFKRNIYIYIYIIYTYNFLYKAHMICFFSNKPSDAGIFSGEAWGSFVSSFGSFKSFTSFDSSNWESWTICHVTSHVTSHVTVTPSSSFGDISPSPFVAFACWNMVAPPRSRRGVFANQVRIYVKGMTKHTIFLHYFFPCGLFKPAKKHWGPSEKQGILLILPCEIVIFGRWWSSKTIFFHG